MDKDLWEFLFGKKADFQTIFFNLLIFIYLFGFIPYFLTGA
jgi:hypothetical protein